MKRTCDSCKEHGPVGKFWIRTTEGDKCFKLCRACRQRCATAVVAVVHHGVVFDHFVGWMKPSLHAPPPAPQAVPLDNPPVPPPAEPPLTIDNAPMAFDRYELLPAEEIWRGIVKFTIAAALGFAAGAFLMLLRLS